MFGIFVTTIILECLVFLPVSFTIFQFFLTPSIALLLAFSLCLVSSFACWLCNRKLRPFVYRSISFVVSILFAYIAAGQVSILMFILAMICIFIFIGVRKDINSDTNAAPQISLFGLFFNIILALITVYSNIIISVNYCNFTILISTISSVILLIVKQTNDSRRFGKNSMRIGNTQRKNNQIFAVTTVIILIGVSAIGQVSYIYRLIIDGIKWLLKMYGSMFVIIPIKGEQVQEPPKKLEAVKAVDPSTFERIIEIIKDVLAIAITVALVGSFIYFFAKAIINLVRRIINWFRNGEHKVERYCENGHIDEKQSLYNKKLSEMAKKLRQMVGDLFDKEPPYNKLPNNIAKVRRLFKYYKSKAQKLGVSMSKSSTSEEICQGVSEKIPETKQFNNLLSSCYAAARYGEVAPSSQELNLLESKLLK